MNISEASRSITIKFYLKHHWGDGKAAWGFGADQFRTQFNYHSIKYWDTLIMRFPGYLFVLICNINFVGLKNCILTLSPRRLKNTLKIMKKLKKHSIRTL